MSWIGLYVKLATASLRAQMQYKFNFVFSSAMVFGMFGIEFLTVWKQLFPAEQRPARDDGSAT